MALLNKITNLNGFKETEIGMIPEDWGVAKLIDHVDLERGTEPGSGSYNKEGKGLRFLRVVDISGSRKDIIYTPSDNIKLCSVDDILITFDGSPGIVRRGLEGAYSSGIRKVLFKDIKLDKDFIYFALQTNFVKNKIEEFSTGVTIKHASKSIPQIQLPLPPLSEQKKIAAVLSAVQEAKEKTEEVIRATKELKKSLMKKLFTEGVIIGFMFDTNIFNAILDEQIPIERLPRKFSYFVTHIQKDELEKTPEQERRVKLCEVFENIDQDNISTAPGVWGVSKWGNSSWSDGNFYKKILNDLNQIEKKKNNVQDALIGETAIKNGLILITNDKTLAEVVKKNSGQAIDLEDFFASLYPKLKQTEIGLIPEDWEVVKLGDCLQKTKQKDMRKTSEEFDYIDVSSIDRDYLRIISITKYKGKNAPSRARKIVRENDVIIATVRPTLKRVALIPKKYDNQVCSTAFCVLRGDEDIDNRFIYYTVQRDMFIDALGNIQRGASYPAVTDSDVKNQKIPLPSLPIQQKIAEILSAVDKKIEAEENKKKSLEDLFKTLLNKLMTGKIRFNNLEV